MLSRLRSRAFVQLRRTGRGRQERDAAPGRFASTEVAFAALYHRMGDCHATRNSPRAGEIGRFAGVERALSDAQFTGGGQEGKRGRNPLNSPDSDE
jgi:hypothetical protein